MRRNGQGPLRRRSAATIRDRLNEAEATLAAIRAGQVDALVVSGPEGSQTRTIEGASHPYFVLLNAMSDGAAILDRDGTILFGNLRLGTIAGRGKVEKLRGSLFRTLVAPRDRSGFEIFLRDGFAQTDTHEFTLLTGARTATPVAIKLSALPLGTYRDITGSESRETAVIMAIIVDLTSTKAAEATRARLLQRLIAAEDDERRRIARELHDETGQSLAALLVGLRRIADSAASRHASQVAHRLRDLAAQTMEDVGRLARGLHPSILDDHGLSAAAQRYVGDYATSFGIAPEFVARDVDSPRLPPAAAATAYRILQEALTNVARHARATRIAIELTRDESALGLLVQDDGIGFDVTRARNAHSGLGLHGMRERVTLLGGSLLIESGTGLGTTVRARIPVQQKSRRKKRAGSRKPSARSRR